MPRLAFTEYDAYAETVRDVSVRMRMCSRQVSKWTMQFAAVGALAVQNGCEGGGSIAEGVDGRDAWSFYPQSHPGRANGHDLNEDEVFAVPPGGEFCLVCKPSHEWISVHIPPRLLFPPALESESASCASARLLKPPPQVTRRFKSLAHRVLATTESHPRLLDCPVAVDSCQDELLAAAQGLFTSCQPFDGGHFDRWRGITKSILELAMSDPDRSLSITELAQQAGCLNGRSGTRFIGATASRPRITFVSSGCMKPGTFFARAATTGRPSP